MRLASRPSGWIVWLRDLLVAAGSVGVGFVARLLIDSLIPGQVPFVTFYPAVMAASLITGYRAGLIAVALSTPLAVIAFGMPYPFMTTAVWLVLACIVAVGCGLAHELRVTLRAERDELERTRQKLELVIGEQAHRAKNTFAILNALAAQSAQGATNVEEFRDRLIARVQALSSAYSLMSAAEPDAPLVLDKLVETALAPFSTAYSGRLTVPGGPAVDLAPSTAIPISLCLHELATNAVKYGALSRSDGQWSANGSNGLPAPTRCAGSKAADRRSSSRRTSGFGTRLVSAALNGVPGGSAVMRFEPGGVQCDLAFNGSGWAKQVG